MLKYVLTMNCIGIAFFSHDEFTECTIIPGQLSAIFAVFISPRYVFTVRTVPSTVTPETLFAYDIFFDIFVSQPECQETLSADFRVHFFIFFILLVILNKVPMKR